jgi:hypothetical protein
VASTIAELVALATRLRDNQITVLADGENNTAHLITGYQQHRITAPAPFIGRPQATIGVKAMSIPQLFNSITDMRIGRSATGGDEPLEFDRVVGSPTLVHQMARSLTEAREFLRQAFEAKKENFFDEPELIQQELTGFLAVILKTLWDAYSNSGRDLTDPKYAFPLMPRTDFVSMLDTLEPAAQDSFKDLWRAEYLAYVIGADYPLDAQIFTYGYRAGHRRYWGPTKREWIQSIVDGGVDAGGGDTKDAMSPPPGYPRHHTVAQPEGLGAYGADNNLLLLFELRDLHGEGPLPPERWLELARAVCRLVAIAEEDDRLNPG